MNNIEMKFKSNIKCTGCVEKVKPFLDEIKEIENWEVDTLNPDKILTVKSTREIEKEIQEAITKAGYSVDKL